MGRTTWEAINAAPFLLFRHVVSIVAVLLHIPRLAICLNIQFEPVQAVFEIEIEF